MTGSQRRLYTGMLRLFREYQTGGDTWTGVRADGDPSVDATTTTLAAASLYFVQNQRIREMVALPNVALFTAPWYGLPLGGVTVNVEVGDVWTNGDIAFYVQGIDTSQGFQLIPAALTQLPAVAAGSTRITQSGATRITQTGATRLVA